MKIDEKIKDLKAKLLSKQIAGFNALIELNVLIKDYQEELKLISSENNNEEIIETFKNIEKSISEFESPDFDKLLNGIKNIKLTPEVNITISSLKEVKNLLEIISNKETSKIDINKLIKWPKKPKDAIPVVLTEKSLKSFYDAISEIHGIGGGGANVDTTKLATKVLQQLIIDNQLPNDHDVNVSNMIPDVETGLSTSENQTNGDQKAQMVDAVGTNISIVYGHLLAATEAGNLNHADGVNNSRYAQRYQSNKVYNPVFPYIFNGDTWDRLRGTGGELNVKIKSPLESNGAIPVNIQDQHTEIIDLHLTKQLGTFTLASNLSEDDTSFDVEAGHSIQVGEMLCFQETSAFMQAEVLSVSTNTIGIDTPIDFPFTTAAVCSNNLFNLNVDGSSSAQTFSVSPYNLQAGAKWDITRIMIVIEDQTDMDTSKFGGLDKLTRGIVLRVNNGNNKNIFNIKTNGDFASHSYDVTYDDKAPAGFYGLRVRTSFAGQDKRGVTIRLSKDDSDSLELIIQDDLQNLDIFHVVAQGHVVTD